MSSNKMNLLHNQLMICYTKIIIFRQNTCIYPFNFLELHNNKTNQEIYELTIMKLKSHQQMRNFNKNLDGNCRNSDKSHLGLKMLHPRIPSRVIQTRKELISPVNFGEAQIHTPFGAEGQPLKTTLNISREERKSCLQNNYSLFIYF